MGRDALTQKAIERKLARGKGVSMGALTQMREADKAQTDWRGRCRVCGTSRTGTIASLRGACPVCEGASSG